MSENHNSDCILLEARNIGRKTVEGVWLLRDVSLNVKNSDRWAITGPTGSGKTLFLRALCLMDEIDEGEILWKGHSIENQDIPLFRRQVIYLHQRPVLFEGSVEDNLRLPFSLLVTQESEKSREFDQAWILKILAELGRDESFLSKKADDLSGGEAQITALLRAVQLQPVVLMLDEPTAALDALSVTAIETLVDRWLTEPNQQRACIWVSHDTKQVERIAEKTLRLQQGQIQR
jgi:putative ABC transport system ATP-binding protein